MAKWCPVEERRVIYQFCEDCDDKVCRKPDFNKNGKDTDNGISNSEQSSANNES